MSQPLAKNTLVLTPTDLERQQILPKTKDARPPLRIELCGFGVVAAAARTAGLIAKNKPDLVILIGMAGTYDPLQLKIGQAACFEEVSIDGIGAGLGAERLTAEQIGFPYWPGGEGTDPSPIREKLKLYCPTAAATGGQLLTVCATSATREEAAERKRRFPQALAEDMEGFGVAVACRLAGVPLTIIRGISNPVGERDVKTWRIDEPLRAGTNLLLELLGLAQIA